MSHDFPREAALSSRSDQPVTALRPVRPGAIMLSREEMPEPKAGEVLIRSARSKTS